MQTIAKSQSNMVVQVHPLVIMNAADHCNRARYIEPIQTRVLGVLLGKQEDKVIDLVNSLEISFKIEANQIIIDEAYLQRRLEAYKKMFPTLEIMGWYSTGITQTSDFPDVKNDLQIQKSIQRFCENPIYLIMNLNSEAAKNKKQVPIFVYETNQTAKVFESLDFQLAKSEEERIAVENVTKAIDPNAKKS